MKNLNLVDKLVSICDSARDKFLSVGDHEGIERIDSYEQELIEELQKDNEVYELVYGEDVYRSNGCGDRTHYSSIELLQEGLKELLREDDSIICIETASVVGEECHSIEYFDGHNNRGQYELSNGSNSVYFSISTLDIE